MIIAVMLLVMASPSHAAKKKKRRKKTPVDGALSKTPVDGALSTYASVEVQMGVGPSGRQAALEVMLPPASQRRPIASPAQLMSHVKSAWDSFVAPHQAGLADPRAGPASKDISAGEAWHHWQASQSGVIDSARFLVAFGVVPFQAYSVPGHESRQTEPRDW